MGLRNVFHNERIEVYLNEKKTCIFEILGKKYFGNFKRGVLKELKKMTR